MEAYGAAAGGLPCLLKNTLLVDEEGGSMDLPPIGRVIGAWC